MKEQAKEIKKLKKDLTGMTGQYNAANKKLQGCQSMLTDLKRQIEDIETKRTPEKAE